MKLEEAIKAVDVVIAGVQANRQTRAALEEAWAFVQAKAKEDKKEKKQ